jgi:hypothetical protein
MIVPGSVQINLDTTKAKPDVSHDMVHKKVFLHLTQGFNPDIQQMWADPKKAWAWTATGLVQVTGSIANWDFGFIQFCRTNAMRFNWRGRTVKEGDVSICADCPPALTQLSALDTGRGHPWTVPANSPRFTNVGGQIKAETGDHPVSGAPLSELNRAAAIANFLFQLTDDREYWCVFTAMEPTGKLQYLAHFHIRISFDVEIMWRHVTPPELISQNIHAVVRRQNATLDPSQVVMGPPTEPALQGLLANPQAIPADQFHNNLAAQALLQSEKGGPPNRVEMLVDRRPWAPDDDFWL